MDKYPIVVGCLIFMLSSCGNHTPKPNINKVITDTLSKPVDSSKISPPAPTGADTTINQLKSERIAGALYAVILKKSNDTVYILKKEDTIQKVPNFPGDVSFEDFNRDGYKDLLLTYISNTPNVQDLFLFDPHAQTLKLVVNFLSFPAAEPIRGTKYYFSYHRSGCADMNWDSDLFYIKNYKAIKIGNIAGRQCDKKDSEYGIYIYRVNNDKKILVKKLPVSTLYHYKDFKWGFIKDYWTKNHKFFQ